MVKFSLRQQTRFRPPLGPGVSQAQGSLRAEGERNAGPLCGLIIQEKVDKSQNNLWKLLNFVKSTQKVHICARASVGMAGNKIPPPLNRINISLLLQLGKGLLDRIRINGQL